MPDPSPSVTLPDQRVILLGASNIAIGYRLVRDLLDLRLTGRTELVAAFGHGRSYGKWTQIVLRSFPGIRDCGLWDHVAGWKGEPRPFALLTDVGNDLMYEIPVPTILEWVRECLTRLREIDARVTLTLPPKARAATLTGWTYYPIRTVLFPGNRLSRTEMLSRVEDLHAGLIEIGEEFEARTIDPPLAWYGFDPIHVRRRSRFEAWSDYLSDAMTDSGDTTQPASATAWRWPLAGSPNPQHYRLLGKDRTGPQPAIESDRLTGYFF